MGNRVILTFIMSTIPHKHMHCINIEKYCIFKTMSCQNPKISEIRKGVSKPILKFPHKAIIRTRKCENSFIRLPLPHNALLVIPVDSTSCRKSRRPCGINSIPASQAEALDVEILSSSQGSRIGSVEKSSIVYSFLVRAHNLQILRIEQGSTPRIDRSLWLHFSLMLSQA
jgi:hypothetical protein